MDHMKTTKNTAAATIIKTVVKPSPEGEWWFLVECKGSTYAVHAYKHTLFGLEYAVIGKMNGKFGEMNGPFDQLVEKNWYHIGTCDMRPSDRRVEIKKAVFEAYTKLQKPKVELEEDQLEMVAFYEENPELIKSGTESMAEELGVTPAVAMVLTLKQCVALGW